MALLALDVGNVMITFAGLSFLGLGVVPPTLEWGAMVSEGQVLIDQMCIALCAPSISEQKPAAVALLDTSTGAPL